MNADKAGIVVLASKPGVLDFLCRHALGPLVGVHGAEETFEGIRSTEFAFRARLKFQVGY
jgi:hypothetical protein